MIAIAAFLAAIYAIFRTIVWIFKVVMIALIVTVCIAFVGCLISYLQDENKKE